MVSAGSRNHQTAEQTQLEVIGETMFGIYITGQRTAQAHGGHHHHRCGHGQRQGEFPQHARIPQFCDGRQNRPLAKRIDQLARRRGTNCALQTAL